jgi:ankyrin repeat protein
MAKDYRGQTPLHVATSSGEIGSMLYLASALEGKEDEYREVKDNALMTPLMNTVVENNVPSFCYLYFNKKCSLNHVDIQGNTLMHMAAKSNSINIAKLLRHIYIGTLEKE